MDFCVISFVCLSVQMSVRSQDAALALAPGQQPWDSHSGRTLIQALALTQALTLPALFWRSMDQALALQRDLAHPIIDQTEYNDRHVCLQF